MGMVRAFAPGRTELAGNHVDHQGGVVLAGTIAQGVWGRAESNGTRLIRVRSGGFPEFELDLGQVDFDHPREAERGSSASLARGMVAGMHALGAVVPGFDLLVKSTIPVGGGLSSSAAFELLVGRVVACLADLRVEPLALARMAQAVERDFFGKPCGLMDQATVALGGIVRLDFRDQENPEAERMAFDFAGSGYDVVLVDSHVSHADMAATADYGAIPRDMGAVAEAFGALRLADVPKDRFTGELPRLRAVLGDGAVMRAVHFFRETELAKRRIVALGQGDMQSFLDATALSAASSAQALRNVGLASGVLACVELALDELAHDTGGRRGVARIHGGGFGGSIQVFLPCDQTAGFVRTLDDWLGSGSCNVLQFTQEGVWAAWE